MKQDIILTSTQILIHCTMTTTDRSYIIARQLKVRTIHRAKCAMLSTKFLTIYQYKKCFMQFIY